MHPYHIPEFANERVETKSRRAREHQLVHEARQGDQEDPCDDGVDRVGRGFRIPLFRWEVRMQRVAASANR